MSSDTDFFHQIHCHKPVCSPGVAEQGQGFQQWRKMPQCRVHRKTYPSPNPRAQSMWGPSWPIRTSSASQVSQFSAPSQTVEVAGQLCLCGSPLPPSLLFRVSCLEGCGRAHAQGPLLWAVGPSAPPAPSQCPYMPHQGQCCLVQPILYSPGEEVANETLASLGVVHV